jgi:hypothetical protein
MVVAYGAEYIALYSIKNWFKRFSNRDLSIEDKSQPEKQIN